MAQGTSHDRNAKVAPASASSWEKAAAKRSGYEGVQRADKQHQPSAVDGKYGAWGSTFKSRDHFASMHHC